MIICLFPPLHIRVDCPLPHFTPLCVFIFHYFDPLSFHFSLFWPSVFSFFIILPHWVFTFFIILTLCMFSEWIALLCVFFFDSFDPLCISFLILLPLCVFHFWLCFSGNDSGQSGRQRCSTVPRLWHRQVWGTVFVLYVTIFWNSAWQWLHLDSCAVVSYEVRGLLPEC